MILQLYLWNFPTTNIIRISIFYHTEMFCETCGNRVSFARLSEK